MEKNKLVQIGNKSTDYRVGGINGGLIKNTETGEIESCDSIEEPLITMNKEEALDTLKLMHYHRQQVLIALYNKNFEKAASHRDTAMELDKKLHKANVWIGNRNTQNE